MALLTTFFTYFLIWWVVFFTTLPWGAKVSEVVEEGHDPGAPSITNLKKKAQITSVVTAVITGIIWFVLDQELFSFHEFMREGCC